MQVDIPYGKEKIKVNIPAPCEILKPKKIAVRNENKTIEKALNNPVDKEYFKDFAAKSKSLLVIIKAIPNLKYEFIWEDESGEIIQKKKSEGRFESNASAYFVWNVLESDKMKCGDFKVTFFLNSIRQFTIQFKIKED